VTPARSTELAARTRGEDPDRTGPDRTGPDRVEAIGVVTRQVIVLNGGSSSGKTAHLDGLDVLWVGVHCGSEVAAGREIARGDRVVGVAALQADAVHRGVVYDVEVDTTRAESLECARIIAARVS
jgi:chloramphenicol 3-O phosphotransferase